MPVRSLFATPFYEAAIDDVALLADLDHSCRSLARDDAAGRRWARDHGYRGYTSYASLNDLPARDPAFAALQRALAPHVAAFADAAHLDLGRRRVDDLELDGTGVGRLFGKLGLLEALGRVADMKSLPLESDLENAGYQVGLGVRG